MAKKAAKKTPLPANGDRLSDAPMPVTSARQVEDPGPAQAQPIANGPTTGYRDGNGDTIETADFVDGILPKGWLDTPAKCKNVEYYDSEKLVHVFVSLDGKTWAPRKG